MPQVIAVDGMGDSGFARLGALHGVAHWRRKDPADAAGFAERQQAAEVVLMQAGARGVMHQHPLRLRQRLQAGEYRIGALSAAIHHGNLRMLRQRQLAEAAIAGADGNHHPLDARIRQQRGDRVFENRFVTD